MSKKEQNNKPPVEGRKRPLFALQGYHYRAVEVRYEGKTFNDICGILGAEFRKGVHPDTIRKWFARGGLLENEYLDYARHENERRRQMMREELKKLVTKIPGKLDAIIGRMDNTGQPDMVALMGIKTLIEVLGITASDDPKTGAKLEEYFKKLEQFPSPVAPHAAG